jgi:hypothetical protein
LRTLVTLTVLTLSFASDGLGQLPSGRLLWSMDSVYVLVTVDDRAGIVSRRALVNQVQSAVTAGGLVVTDAAVPGLVVSTTVRGVPQTAKDGSGIQVHLSLALTDNVTRIKYVDAALTRCMSAEGCRRNVEGARALGSRGVLWQEQWLGHAATAAAAADAVEEQLADLVTDFLAAHAAANRR